MYVTIRLYYEVDPLRHFKSRPRWPYLLIAGPVLGLVLLVVLQGPFAHRRTPFVPDYPQQDLDPILAKDQLSPAEYDTLFQQTGLARPAVDHLLTLGDAGRAQIEYIQSQFFAPVTVVCDSLWGEFTKEDHLVGPDGEHAWAPPIADLETGDVILTFSTHSAGWRHGHAGLVVDDAGDGVTLEAVLIGTDSEQVPAWHWRNYSNYMVLRLKDRTPELTQAIADYALEHLDGVPYHLTSGFLGGKAPEPDAPFFGVHCDYLVWYAFQAFGFDLDSDGGRLVTTDDMARSPLLEVVQVYGMDPRIFS